MLASALTVLQSQTEENGPYRCDPNTEDCSHVLDEPFKEYGMKNLGFSAIFKVLVPDLVAGMMFWNYYANNNV